MTYVECNFFLDECLHFLVLDKSFTDVDSEAEHGCDDELVSFKSATTDIVEGLVGD